MFELIFQLHRILLSVKITVPLISAIYKIATNSNAAFQLPYTEKFSRHLIFAASINLRKLKLRKVSS